MFEKKTSRIKATIPSRFKLEDAVENETGATLNNYELNKTYACEVTFSDRSKEISSALSFIPDILEQPTSKNPQISVNFDKNAS
jgi:hypothetical protein